MDVIQAFETFGASLLICLILLKQMDKKEEIAKEERKEDRDRQYQIQTEMLKSQQELLNTNRILADTVERVTEDIPMIKDKIDSTNIIVREIAAKMN